MFDEFFASSYLQFTTGGSNTLLQACDEFLSGIGLTFVVVDYDFDVSGDLSDLVVGIACHQFEYGSEDALVDDGTDDRLERVEESTNRLLRRLYIIGEPVEFVCQVLAVPGQCRQRRADVGDSRAHRLSLRNPLRTNGFYWTRNVATNC